MREASICLGHLSPHSGKRNGGIISGGLGEKWSEKRWRKRRKKGHE